MVEQEMSDMMCDGPAEMDNFTMKFASAYSQISDEYSIFNYYRNAIRIRNTFPVIARGRTAVDYDRTNDSVAAFTRKDSDGKYEPVEIFINSTSEPASVDISGSDFRELKAVLTVSSDEVMLDGTTLTLPAFGICVLGEAK
jgi:glycosidase